METHKITIHHVYRNPCPVCPEDYSLVPSQTEQASESGYQDINTMIARFTKGELCNFGCREENPLADLFDKPIEEIKLKLDELADVSKQDTEQTQERNLSGVPSEISGPECGDNAACEADKKADSVKD